jgi:hypothetical protein
VAQLVKLKVFQRHALYYSSIINQDIDRSIIQAIA